MTRPIRMSANNSNRVDSLVHTSVDDCRATLCFENDLEVLKSALAKSARYNHKTRAKLIQRRIRQVESSREYSEQRVFLLLEKVRHELVTLSGLHAFDGVAPAETFVIDTTELFGEIDATIADIPWLNRFSDNDSHPS